MSGATPTEQPPVVIQEINYADLLHGITNETLILVDVRNPDEILTQGAIPSAINIPLPEVPDAFRNLSPAQFKDKYGFSSNYSESSKLLVFSCKSGRRAEAAIQNILQPGLNPQKLRLYRGSFTDWEAQGGTILRPS